MPSFSNPSASNASGVIRPPMSGMVGSFLSHNLKNRLDALLGHFNAHDSLVLLDSKRLIKRPVKVGVIPRQKRR
jgi:hypothetical protein